MARELTQRDLDRLYAGIERDAIAQTVRQEQPVAILLGGQPGSGKAGLSGLAQAELHDRGGAVLIDADRLREHNPAYLALARTDPEHAADLTHPLAAKWAGQLTERAASERRNLVIDGTMRDAGTIARLAERLNQNGYTVEARVMAVSPDASITRARLRYETLAAEGVAARVVNPKQHDDAYVGIPHTLRQLEESRLAQTIRLYDSHGREVYQNQLENGQWKTSPGAAQTLDAVRDRPWTHAEREGYVQALETILAHAQAREKQQPGVGLQDSPTWASRLQVARADLAAFERSDVYVRAKAFDAEPSAATLARYPEFDGAYRQLADIRQRWTPDMPQAEREQQFGAALSRLSEQFHRGQIPSGETTLEESRRVINLVAKDRNLSLREPEPGRTVEGEVIAQSSKHTLVQVSPDIAIVYERAGLARDAHAGERIALAHETGGHTRVMSPDEAREQAHERGGHQGMDRSR